MKRLILLILFFTPLFADLSTITHMKIEGSISPATTLYFKEVLKEAQGNNSVCIIIELDTPGGVSASMRDMIKDILGTQIPIVIYVSPKGARAASAGTYLLYASHIAAMAPGTNLGAATPINLMQSPTSKDEKKTSPSALEKKMVNDSIAYIKSLAQLRQRNSQWAVEAVKDGKSLSAKDALDAEVIDFIANDLNDLIVQLDGETVKIADKTITLNTKDAKLLSFEADWKTKILIIVSNPNIAYLLMLAAIYGIFFELMNPGSIFPGVIGAIAGIVALYALNVLPFNYAGLLLMALGILLMVAEVFIIGFGILGIGGVIAFGFGSFLLFDPQTLGTRVSLPLIIAFSLVSLGFFLIVIRLFINSRSAKVVSGKDEMIGSTAEVIKITKEGYMVRCHGELWQATADKNMEIGQSALVDSISNLTLNLKSMKE